MSKRSAVYFEPEAHRTLRLKAAVFLSVRCRIGSTKPPAKRSRRIGGDILGYVSF